MPQLNNPPTSRRGLDRLGRQLGARSCRHINLQVGGCRDGARLAHAFTPLAVEISFDACAPGNGAHHLAAFATVPGHVQVRDALLGYEMCHVAPVDHDWDSIKGGRVRNGCRI